VAFFAFSNAAKSTSSFDLYNGNAQLCSSNGSTQNKNR